MYKIIFLQIYPWCSFRVRDVLVQQQELTSTVQKRVTVVQEHQHFNQGLLQTLQQIAASQQQIAVLKLQSVDIQTQVLESLQQLAAKQVE